MDYTLEIYGIGAAKTVSNKERDLFRTYTLYKHINDVLRRSGYPAPVIGIVIAQVMHETGYLTSRLAPAFNLTGIKYFSKNKNHVKYGKVGAYVKFPNLDAWAADLRDNYLKRNDTGAGRPIDATNYVDYAKRLKANRYYEDSLSNYTEGLRRAIVKNNEALRFVESDPKRLADFNKKESAVTWPKSGEVAQIRKEIDNYRNSENTWWARLTLPDKIIIGAGTFLLGGILVNNLTKA